MADELKIPNLEADFGKRVDQLVAEAIEEQAREQRMLLETVHAAQREMTAIRELIERRDLSVVDMLEARMSGMGTEEGIDRVEALIRDLIERPEIHDVVGPVSLQVDNVFTKLEILESVLTSVSSQLERLDPWKPAVEIQRALRDRLAEMAEATRQELASASESWLDKLDTFGSRVETSIASHVREQVLALQSAEHSLTEGLEAHTGTVGISLERSTGDIRTSLGSAAEEIHSSLGESTQQIHTSLAAASQEIHQALQSISDEVRETLQAASARTFDRLIQLQTGTNETMRMLEDVSSKLQESFEEHERKMEEKVEAMAPPIEETLDRYAAENQERSAALSRQVEAIRSDLKSQSPALEHAVARSSEPLIEEIRRLASVAVRAGRGISESNARIEALQQSLVTYLSERDARLERIRDETLMSIVNQIGKELKRRDKMRIGEALRAAEERRKDRRDAERYRKLLLGSEPPAAVPVESPVEIVAEMEKAASEARARSKAKTKAKAKTGRGSPPRQPSKEKTQRKSAARRGSPS